GVGLATGPPVDARPPPPPDAPPPPLLDRGLSTGVGSAGPTSLVVATAGVSGAASGAGATSVVVTGASRVSSRPLPSLCAELQAASPRPMRRAQTVETARGVTRRTHSPSTPAPNPPA